MTITYLFLITACLIILGLGAYNIYIADFSEEISELAKQEHSTNQSHLEENFGKSTYKRNARIRAFEGDKLHKPNRKEIGEKKEVNERKKTNK